MALGPPGTEGLGLRLGLALQHQLPLPHHLLPEKEPLDSALKAEMKGFRWIYIGFSIESVEISLASPGRCIPRPDSFKKISGAARLLLSPRLEARYKSHMSIHFCLRFEGNTWQSNRIQVLDVQKPIVFWLAKPRPCH